MTFKEQIVELVIQETKKVLGSNVMSENVINCIKSGISEKLWALEDLHYLDVSWDTWAKEKIKGNKI